MSKIIFQPKVPSEIQILTFDFTSALASGETVTSASVSASVYSGTDITAGDLISGSASVSSPRVTQKVKSGVLGVTYLLSCTAATSLGQSIVQSGFLSVIPAGA